MRSAEEFVPIGEVVADGRSRIAFGKAGVRQDDKYAVSVNDEGEILLTPLVSIPKRELLVWEDEILRASVAKGLEQIASGATRDLGDFSQYAEEDD